MLKSLSGYVPFILTISVFPAFLEFPLRYGYYYYWSSGCELNLFTPSMLYTVYAQSIYTFKIEKFSVEEQGFLKKYKVLKKVIHLNGGWNLKSL